MYASSLPAVQRSVVDYSNLNLTKKSKSQSMGQHISIYTIAKKMKAHAYSFGEHRGLYVPQKKATGF